ncbi:MULTISPECIES: PQQ-binding-like beta-propeller repeat protein [unclassified Streptomyces]|uniref:outer membrane protein assembly factor BamB family protein n=1 Tax=unclassified Streptomyces TaxID=2593676 RepID=UPI002476ADB1|nr:MULTISPECIES: PQQ-binding-like beta-propeller repeat protein [unclassified Streptomyces]
MRNELIAAGSKVFSSSKNGRVHALDLATGPIRWNARTAPAHLTADEALVYACTTGGKAIVYALDADNGHRRWRRTTAQHATDTAMASDPLHAVADGKVDVLYAPNGASGWGPDLPAPPKNNRHVSMVPVGMHQAADTAALHATASLSQLCDAFLAHCEEVFPRRRGPARRPPDGMNALVLWQRFAIWPGQRRRPECGWPLACQGRPLSTAPPASGIESCLGR